MGKISTEFHWTPYSCIIPLRFTCGSKVYKWNFQLAPISVPILGADFVQHFNLLVDIKGHCVVHADCPESVLFHSSPGPQPAFRSVAFLSAPQHVRKLLEDFPDVLSTDGFTASKPRHGDTIISPNLVLPFSLNLGHSTRRSGCSSRRIRHHGESGYHPLHPLLLIW